MEKSDTPELILEAGRASRHYWADLWRYRELLVFLAWRDIKVRYKETTLGAGWALLHTAVTLVVFTFIFGRLAILPAGGLGDRYYPLLVMSGLLPWQLFANALSNASGSLVGNTHLISKVYFPRLVVPLSSLGVAAVDFLFVALLAAGLFAWYGYLPGWQIVFLPLFFRAGAALARRLEQACGSCPDGELSRLPVQSRAVPAASGIVFLTPVGFSTTNLPHWRGFVRAQSDGRRDRRFPVVPVPRATGAGSAHVGGRHRHHPAPPGHRPVVFPPHGTPPSPTSSDHERTGHQRHRPRQTATGSAMTSRARDTLRDTIVGAVPPPANLGARFSGRTGARRRGGGILGVERRVVRCPAG